MAKKIPDPEVEKLLAEAKAEGMLDRASYNDTREQGDARSALADRFPTIRSIEDPFSGFRDIRRRMKAASQICNSWHGHGGWGCLEMSIPDILSHDGAVYGRNFVVPACGIGVHDVVYPNDKRKDGTPIPPEERKENRKKGRRIIGINCNGSATAKAMAAWKCLQIGVRCTLSVGGSTIVDNWPDYDEDLQRLHDANCSMMLS